jgi:hypothetical protein
MPRNRTLSTRAAAPCPVRDLDGAPLGRVEELAIDVASGRVTAVTLAVGEGASVRFLTVPWEALGVDPEGSLLLNLPLETLLAMRASVLRQDSAGDGQLAAGAPSLS